MSKMGQIVSEQQLRVQREDVTDPEPENVERYSMTKEQEKEFESWARRLVPTIAKRAV